MATLALSGDKHRGIRPEPFTSPRRTVDDPTTVLHTYAHLLPRSDERVATTVAAHLVDSPLTTPAI